MAFGFPRASLLLCLLTRQGEAEYRSHKWRSRTGELMVGFLDLPKGPGVRCSTSYFTLLPIQEGARVQAGQFYEYSGTFLAPFDSATVSMAVGYGQHVWVDYIKLDMLHDGTPREYECTEGVSSNPETPCVFPFVVSGNVVPFCSNVMYWAEGWGWCALDAAIDDDAIDGIACHESYEVQGVDWELCDCADTDGDGDGSFTLDEENCEAGRRTTLEGGDPCVFPFVYNGITYRDCTSDPYDTWVDGAYPPTRPWCALDGEAYRIGECAPCGDVEVMTSELQGNVTVLTSEPLLPHTFTFFVKSPPLLSNSML